LGYCNNAQQSVVSQFNFNETFPEHFIKVKIKMTTKYFSTKSHCFLFP